MGSMGANADRHFLLLAVVLIGTIAGGYSLTTAIAGQGKTRSPWTIAEEGPGFAARHSSGEYLTAYVFVAAACGFSTESQTMDAIGRLPDSLHASHGERFSNVSVVGVAVDQDVEAGLAYFERMGRARHGFDQLAVGGSWLNDQVVNLVWRNNLGEAATPQVLLVVRTVDVEAYPDNIDVSGDRRMLSIQGREDIINWVNSGVPLGVGPDD